MILHGDCRERLRELDPGSVQCCVTSPPYWGLRDYGTATWDGGDEACDHRAPSRFDYPLNAGLGPTGVQDQASNAGSGSVQQYRDLCGKCGARRVDQQLGLEPTPEAYVANMVEVFDLVRQVLADDGVLWLNLGDSYANVGNASPTMHNSTLGKKPGEKGCHMPQPVKAIPAGLKSKDLCGIPWRVAFALQAAGWYLRSDIIWAKPNPMPESVTDRPTKAHEYLFLLSKRERYYYDAEAIAEARTDDERTFLNKRQREGSKYDQSNLKANNLAFQEYTDTRNRRSVWTIATQPYADAHFATFPPALVEPCIAAGSRPGDIVLDPFGGSGTVGEVAERLGRRYVLIELNEKYLPLIAKRTAQQGLAL